MSTSHWPAPFSLSPSLHLSSLYLPEPWCGIPIGADGSAMVHAFPLQNTKQWGGGGKKSCVKAIKKKKKRWHVGPGDVVGSIMVWGKAGTGGGQGRRRWAAEEADTSFWKRQSESSIKEQADVSSLFSSRLKWEQSVAEGWGGDYREAESTTSEANLDLPHIKVGGVTFLFNDIGTTRYLIMYWSEIGTSSAAAAAIFLLKSARVWRSIKQTKSNLCSFNVLYINSNKCWSWCSRYSVREWVRFPMTMERLISFTKPLFPFAGALIAGILAIITNLYVQGSHRIGLIPVNSPLPLWVLRLKTFYWVWRIKILLISPALLMRLVNLTQLLSIYMNDFSHHRKYRWEKKNHPEQLWTSVQFRFCFFFLTHCNDTDAKIICKA